MPWLFMVLCATGDIDLWIRISDDNAEKARRALQSFGASLFDLSLSDLKTPGIVFQIGLVPSRIDIITHIDAVEFGEAWENRETLEIEGLQIPVIGRVQLLKNKKSTGRAKDRNDALWLEEEQ